MNEPDYPENISEEEKQKIKENFHADMSAKMKMKPNMKQQQAHA